MTEEIFTELGFERTDVSMEESGCSNGFYYYALEIGDICIMSNSNEEANKNGWEAFIFDFLSMRIKGGGDLESLVKIIKNNSNG